MDSPAIDSAFAFTTIGSFVYIISENILVYGR